MLLAICLCNRFLHYGQKVDETELFTNMNNYSYICIQEAARAADNHEIPCYCV